MLFRKLNRDGAEKVWIACRNVSGATISAHTTVELDVTTVTDGNAVTACKSGSLAGLFVGIADQALADSAYGLVQVYGFRTSAYISKASAGDVPGKFLVPTTGYLDSGVTMSAATTSGHVFVTLAETITASVGYSSAAQLSLLNVFIRAM